ncbi:MAG: ABC transporter ATP-binding protein [Clostridia bacterium]|nr:ABC transporter ATP-binding protein [Clostridia bacterium]
MIAIQTVGLTKRYKDLTAVDNLNLTIEQGELFALLGINGAGKTTTIKMLCCLTQPDDGDATIMGHSITNNSQAVKQLINISPQETAIAQGLSVKENLLLIAQLHGATMQEAEQKTQDLATNFGLTEVLHNKAKTLSGGMQRRLSIAMALVSAPQILFLDEPTLGLDIIARRELWRTIEALKGKITIILTTHYLEEAEHLADRIGIMYKGKITAVGSSEQLIERSKAINFEEAFIAYATEGGTDE